jgi:hypothetical protein
MKEEFKNISNLVDKIRGKDISYLSIAENLEHELLPELGLNDEYIHEFPESLHKHCGHGLRSWQYPNQFSKYLIHLSKLNIESYLEIGVRHGGTFIITVEYLNRFKPIKRALGIDIETCPLILEYRKELNPNADFWQIDSTSDKFASFCRYCDNIDLVLIDGDHFIDCVNCDYENINGFAKNIALHDISNEACMGVKEVWDRLKEEKHRYKITEFIEQYPEMSKENHFFFGMGLLENKVR